MGNRTGVGPSGLTWSGIDSGSAMHQPVSFPLAIRNMHPMFRGLRHKSLPGIANHPPRGRPLRNQATVGRHPLPRSLVQYLSKVDCVSALTSNWLAHPIDMYRL
jgi:hypothetical protein